ncbi:transcriptional regulator [Zavarzinia sp.]|uniref:transcriptional regulator n=1 Tax=Zavarzinia sp. TaxID=2027920 RepID=UPI0035677F24
MHIIAKAPLREFWARHPPAEKPLRIWFAQVQAASWQGPAEGSAEAARFDVLTTLIEAYEAVYWPIEALDPIDMIEAHMAASGRSQADLAALFGSRSRASEVLGRKRGLTLAMVDKLTREWGIPAEALVRPYKLTSAA